MPIEQAVFHDSDNTWAVYWTAPGDAPSVEFEVSASFTALQSQLGGAVSFDASASDAGDGTIIEYRWDFGDGSRITTTADPRISYQYVKAGTYSVLLTITDDSGNTAEVSQRVASVVDIYPEAIFSYQLSQLHVSVDASASFDRDGSIVRYAWDFGDGATASGITANHTYPFGGTYAITLLVTDNLGAVAYSSQSITAAPLPDAEFTFTTSGRTVTVDATGTNDFNPISTYTWSWGIAGSTDSTGVRASHAYPSDGTYPVTLSIRDIAGNTDFITHEVTVALIKAPDPPVVSFVTSTTNLTATFNASKSTDSDSTILLFAWNFGDSHTGTGVTTSHTYVDGGTYTVSCTATDQLGATGTAHKNVTVSPVYKPPPPPPPPTVNETLTWPYQDMNRRQVVSDDNYDPDTSWANHQARGSLGGVDHNAPYGTPLYANSSGRVYQTSLANGGSGGRTLSIYTGSTGWYDQYMHLSRFAVSDGATVKQGQLVGYSGASGFGQDFYYAPHFHLHRYTSGGTRVNSWHYFCGSGNHDSRNDKPGPIVITLSTGVPNITFYRRLQWYAKTHGYTYPCDGYMSIPAWKGVQRGMAFHGYTGPIDGLPGTNLYKALQSLAHSHGSTSAIDGSLSTSDYKALSSWLNEY